MKKLKYKKILFFILVCICFFLTDKYIVKAATTPYWGYDLEHFNDGYFYDCNSSGCNNSISTGAQWGTDSSGTQYPGFFSGISTTVANSYGIMFVTTFPNQSLFKGYLYSLNTYVCSTGTSYPTLVNYYFGSLDKIEVNEEYLEEIGSMNGSLYLEAKYISDQAGRDSNHVVIE